MERLTDQLICHEAARRCVAIADLKPFSPVDRALPLDEFAARFMPAANLFEAYVPLTLSQAEDQLRARLFAWFFGTEERDAAEIRVE